MRGARMCSTSSLFKLLLFQAFVLWCGAKHVAYAAPRSKSDIAGDIQDKFSEFLHVGKYSSEHLDPKQAEVVVPLKVSRDGEHLSHVLEHSHEHLRTRRSTNEHEHSLYYNVTIGGRDLRLDLRPSLSFVTPSMVIERRSADGTRSISAPNLRVVSCHYRGSVRGQPLSKVTLSACDGLAGLLRTDQGEFWIEPTKNVSQELDSSMGRPHLVYKRSAISDKPRTQSKKQNPPNIKSQTFDKRRVHNKAYLEKRKRNRLRQLKNNIQNRNQMLRTDYKQRLRQKQYNAQRISQQTINRQQNRMQQGITSQQKNYQEQPKQNYLNTIDKSGHEKSIKPKNVNKRLRAKNKRRRKRSKNCATNQPPYSQIYGNLRNKTDLLWKNNTHIRHYPHHHLLSHRKDFPTPINSRRSRSVSRAYHVEVLLVADDTMVNFHREDIDIYLLTIMNMVSVLYLDHTIGNSINVVVVKILLIESMVAEPSLNLTNNTDKTLSSFCTWQKLQNSGEDSHRHHHDVGIFVTRRNLCGENDPNCSTLGIAHVAGMCHPERSCSLNEDNGLSLAHTIAHELGHNFGLYHDTAQIGCQRRVGSTIHIMTPVFDADAVGIAWSPCSRRDVTTYLDSGMMECLLDEPSTSSLLYDYPQMPAGMMFDAESQCRLMWGGDVHEVCNSPSDPICTNLWCKVGKDCKTNMRGAASGTPCGPEMWCQNRECVPLRDPLPSQDGGWGSWSDWSSCSRTCGGGVSTQQRQCDSPLPERGGKFCVGERTRYKICNTETCAKTKLTFREQQCLKYGNESRPTLDDDEPCQLFCSQANKTATPLRDFADDGTSCREGTNDMCISGICRKVGCDWVLDSNATVDRCGVCNGDGVGCALVHGIFSKDTTKESGYSEVAVIPAGSRNVKVEEIANPRNYIGIVSVKSRKFYLNGKKRLNGAVEYLVAGSPAIYERNRDWEKVHITGPIKEDIQIYQRVFSGKHRNPGVTYQYTIDRKHRNESRYSWKIADWSPCSATCGESISRLIVHCIDEMDRVVDQEICISQPELQRPQEQMQYCRTAPCDSGARHDDPTGGVAQTDAMTQPAADPPSPATHWSVGTWSACSHFCYRPGGQKPVRRRRVHCLEKMTNKVMDDSFCDTESKPITLIHCKDVPPCSERFSV